MKYQSMAHVVFATRWRDVVPLMNRMYAMEPKYGVDVKIRFKKILARMPVIEVAVLGPVTSTSVAMAEIRGLDVRPDNERPPVKVHHRPPPRFPQ